MTIVHLDAHVALQHTVPGNFDAIVTDVFHDIAVPYHLVTREFMALVPNRQGVDDNGYTPYRSAGSNRQSCDVESLISGLLLSDTGS